MDLVIKDIESMLVFLRSVLQIVPDALAGAKFEVGEEITEVKVVNESKTVRTFFSTNVMTCETPTTIYFQDVTKLFKSISLIQDIEQAKTATLNFTGNFIIYQNDVKFRLKTQKAETVERFCTEPIKAVLNMVYGFTTNPDRIKKILQCAGIVNNTEAKVYFVKHGEGLIAEIDEKKSKMVDSVGLPISEKVTGDVTDIACVTLDNFRLFTILPVENVNIILTDKNALTINSEYKKDDTYINMYLVCSLTKG